MARFFFTLEANMDMIVQGGKPMGGAVVATQVWMKALHELDNEILLSRSVEDTRIIVEEYNWIKPVKVFHSKKGVAVIRWPLYRFPKIFNVLNITKPDFVFESIPTWVSFFNGVFCRFLGIKQILRLANDNMLDERINLTHSFIDQKLIFKAFKYCDFILTQNEFQYSSLKKRFPKKKIIKIFNPVVIDPNYLKIKPKAKGYIAWVANFRAQKNLQLLYNVAKNIPEEQFVIAGQPLFPLDPETAEFLEKLKTLENVGFVGGVSRNEILQFYSKAKFLLNTSRYEGFSNTFIEAMQTGTPIITTSNVNPDNMIIEHKLGYIYVEAQDIRLFLENLTDLDYGELSTNCINFVQKNHDHLILGKKFMDFLKEE